MMSIIILLWGAYSYLPAVCHLSSARGDLVLRICSLNLITDHWPLTPYYFINKTRGRPTLQLPSQPVFFLYQDDRSLGVILVQHLEHQLQSNGNKQSVPWFENNQQSHTCLQDAYTNESNFFVSLQIKQTAMAAALATNTAASPIITTTTPAAISTRDFSSAHTQQPGPKRDFEVDPYLLLDDELKYIYHDMRQVSVCLSSHWGALLTSCPFFIGPYLGSVHGHESARVRHHFNILLQWRGKSSAADGDAADGQGNQLSHAGREQVKNLLTNS